MFQSSKSPAYTEVKPVLDTEELTTQGPNHHHGVQQPLENEYSPRQKSIASRFGLGSFREAWQFTITSGALAGCVVLVINLVTLLVVYTRFSVVDNASVVFEGSCSTTSRVTIGSHVIINVLSTVLLAYSNYAMQCVSAPTRKEIDKAHGRRRWVSIGTPTIRNLFFVSPWKSCLWILIWISSFPLHLLWNSTVFQTQASNNYFAISITPDALNITSSVLSLNDSLAITSSPPSSIADVVRRFQDLTSHQSSTGLVERLDVTDCIKAYGTDSMASRRNVLLVVDPVNVTSLANPIIAAYSSGDFVPFQWMCDSSFDANLFVNGGGWSCPQELLNTVSAGQEWIPGQSDYSGAVYGAQDGNPIQFCYSERIDHQDQHCKVNIVPLFLIVVIICNTMKVVSFVLCLRVTKKNPPILTTGDAIASFLETPDPFTQGRCLASKYDYDKGFRRSKEWSPRPRGVFDIWQGGRYRWGKAIRGIQWTFSILCVSTVIMLGGAFFGPGGIGSGTTESWPSIWRLGLGQPHNSFYVGNAGIHPLLTTFLAANWAQLLVSYLYLFLSNMFTTMAAMAEFCAFSTEEPRGLRVSAPQKGSEQKSSYFLSLPYRFAIPLMVSVTALHYFVSEMVFLAQIETYNPQGNLDLSASTTNVFFSPLAMFISVSLGSALVLVLIVVGIFKKYPSTPLAGCCSASIAASCQPPPGYGEFPADLALKKLKWGVLDYDRRGVGHATFSADEVARLQVNHGYA